MIRLWRLPLRLACLGVIVFLAAAYVLQRYWPEHVAGVVFDCLSHNPISGAPITVELSDWGFHNSRLVWDNTYTYQATTDAKGAFRVTYRHGSAAKAVARLPGYINAEEFFQSGDEIRVGMLRGHIVDATRGCVPYTGCLQRVWIDGSPRTYDVCAGQPSPLATQ